MFDGPFNGFTVFMLAVVLVGIPVIFGVGLEFFRTWTKHKQEMARALSEETAHKAARYAAQSERLEGRVRVLERIVTDRGMDVSNRIELLRDERPLN